MGEIKIMFDFQPRSGCGIKSIQGDVSEGAELIKRLFKNKCFRCLFPEYEVKQKRQYDGRDNYRVM